MATCQAQVFLKENNCEMEMEKWGPSALQWFDVFPMTFSKMLQLWSEWLHCSYFSSTSWYLAQPPVWCIQKPSDGSLSEVEQSLCSLQIHSSGAYSIISCHCLMVVYCWEMHAKKTSCEDQKKSGILSLCHPGTYNLTLQEGSGPVRLTREEFGRREEICQSLISLFQKKW